MALRDDWKKTGKGLGNAFQDLGKSIIKSVKHGVDKADEWANSENNNSEAKGEGSKGEPTESPKQ